MSGTATRPVVVSQFGPQSTLTPRACASLKVSGSGPLGATVGADDVETPGARAAMSATAATTPMKGR